MKLSVRTLILSLLVFQGSPLQVPIQLPSPVERHSLISPATENYIHTLLEKWGSSGLSVAVVRKDDSEPTGWRHEFGSYGIAQEKGALPVTPDSVFAIASNSKLFLAISVGLLISNETLASERGKEIKWSTKIHELIPEWGLMDEEMERSVSIQDMLSHITGMPRHDLSHRKGTVSEMISNIRHLRPSAEHRETFQYTNIMYETLSYLPQVLLNQTYESYIAKHLFNPLNMSASTFSVAEAESWGTLADGFQRDQEDITRGRNGTLRAAVPYFARPGEEVTCAGASGVLSTARDLAIWVSMLLNDGRHPYTNETIAPSEIIEHVAYGRSVSQGKPDFPELSPKVYGAGQWRYSYQGHAIIEHGGSNPGYKTQVARFPDDNLAIVSMSNDEKGFWLMEAVKWRIADEILGVEQLNWNDRYEEQYNKMVEKAQNYTRRPSSPKSPTAPLSSLAQASWTHPTYGTLKPCLVPASVPADRLPSFGSTNSQCDTLLNSYPVKRILRASDLSIPTYIIPFKRTFTTHLHLNHFSGNTFNLTALWSNADVREQEGYGHDNVGDLVTGWGDSGEVEWVNSVARGMEGEVAEKVAEEGLAFKKGFWGSGGPTPKALDGTGKESAEVWFKKD